MSRRIPAVVLTILAAAFPPSAPAQEDPPVRAEEAPPITGVVRGEGFTKIAIAVPGPASPTASDAEVDEFIRTLRDDLAFSGFFGVVDPARYGLIDGWTRGGKVDHDAWRSIGADAVLLSELSVRGGRIDLVARLWDNPGKSMLFGTRYGGTVELARRVAHQVADDLVKHYTGRPGVALTRIAFVSRHGEGKEIYLMDYDGQRVRRLTTTGTINLTPTWSPDGDRLCFVSWRGGAPGVHILESDGRLVSAPVVGGELNASPDWSPDGSKLVYASDAPGNAEIYVLDLVSGRNTRLTRNPSIDTAPSFSPTGREIAFTSDRSGTPQIWVMDAEGLNVRRVSFDSNYNDSPAWSPTGDRLAFTSRADRRFDIVVLDLATGTIRNLTRGEGNNENPRWSPDGRHIVFASSRSGKYDIYVMRADGSEVRRLTRGGDSFTPDWSR